MLKKVPKKNTVANLKKLSADWKSNDLGTQIYLTKKFSSYLQAFMFVTRVSINAEVLAIYPEITLTQSSVKITITSKTSLTTADYSFAERIDVMVLSTAK